MRIAITVLSFFLLSSRAVSQWHGSSGPTPPGGMGALVRSAAVQKPPLIRPFLKIRGRDHPGIGHDIAALGDVNGDGYGDFASSTQSDTTFIFFGGPNLDDKADGFVHGGGKRIVAGDINGDGFTDLITAQLDLEHILDPENRGLIRIYLHNRTTDPYDAQPSLTMTGKNERSNLGRSIAGIAMRGGDVNGDGKYDLLIQGYNDRTPNGIGILYLYLGSATPDTVPDFEFMDTRGGEVRRNFANLFAVVDLNRDNYDDVIIQGIAWNSKTNEEIHLGNPQAQFGAPYKDVDFQDPSHGRFPWDLVDMNGDNCAEIIPASAEMNPPFGWGKCDSEFHLQTFLPDTVFPNPDPSDLGECDGIFPTGRFNDTPYNCYSITWADPPNNESVEVWIFQSGPGWQTRAIGYFELRVYSEGVGGYTYPLGDVTGDNVDDFALIHGWDPTGIGHPIWIFKGDPQYKLVATDQIPSPKGMEINLYPNPVTSFDQRRVYIQGKLEKPTSVEVAIYDVLGRERLALAKVFDLTGPFQIPVGIEHLAAGQYFVAVRTGGEATVRSLVVLTH